MTIGAPTYSLTSRARRLIDTNHGTLRGLVRTLLGQCEYLAGRLEPHTRTDAGSIDRLVFVCLGNINRSAFAEQVARSLGARTCSIGLSTTTGKPAFRTAVATATGFGIDLGAHKATDLSDYAFLPTDLLLAMEIRHIKRLVAAGVPARRIALLGHWSSPHRIHLHDPYTLSDAYFRTCFTLIHSAVTRLVADLRSAQSPCLR